MGMMELVKTGKDNEPPRIMIYGFEGIGKSTFAASAPRPVFIQTEDGLGQIDTAKLPLCTSYEDVLKQLKAVLEEKHEYATLAIDSLDWLERLIWDRVCADYGVKSIEKADGGWGHGYTQAMVKWKEVFKYLDAIRSKRRMAIILVAHAKIERSENPEVPSSDRYSPRLHKLAYDYIGDWVDAILFATRRVRYDTETGKLVAVGANGGERILRTNESPAFRAKNRYGLPFEMAFTWQAFIDGLKVGSKG